MNAIFQPLSSQGFLLADGATGTNLFAKGLMTGDAPELSNLTAPEKITELHNEFILAGSDIILTNSFGGTSYRLKLHNADDKVAEVNKAAAMIARKAADASDRPVIVAGSMGPTGELFIPLGALDEAGAVAAFREQAEALADGGADILWIETMSSHEEVMAAISAAKTTGLPVFVTMTFDTAGRSMMGIEPRDFADKAIVAGVAGFGANCGIGPAELLHSLFGMVEASNHHEDVVLIAKGNCGIPAYVDGEIHYHGTPELMADYALAAYRAGASIIGGCCGTTPAHIAAMRQAREAYLAKPHGRQEITQQEAASLLGQPWANVPTPPQTDNKAKARRRRRKT